MASTRPLHYSSGENVFCIYMAKHNVPPLLRQHFLPSDELLQVWISGGLLLWSWGLGNTGGTLRVREGLGHEWLAPAYSDSFMVSVCYRLGFGSREHPLLVVSWNKELDLGLDSGRNRQFYRKEKGTPENVSGPENWKTLETQRPMSQEC